ncbi:NIK- and IKBKB-binding protein, putative [Ixodes scapularis]|uniref:NIK-and IKBKB-binding protein, putative n=1 Tax=Ixodes scapularis TaxID=6945 RepID=B7PW52_IXOSC|nr:NIK- and IKBKB-binding protein, putative [Ixodes scapularis]|eukprot:XP_002409303.1 NIK- and IKBKB-binding protein, putative [Ixodes scapularis]
MSFVDYEARVEDHQCLLVLVRTLGPDTSGRVFGRAWERISRLCHTRLNDQQQGSRTVWLRYVRSYPVEASEWGDFQAHRRVLGLLTIGQCKDQAGLEEVCRLHSALQEQYKTAIDSRCLVFGLDSLADGTEEPPPSNSAEGSCTADEASPTSPNEETDPLGVGRWSKGSQEAKAAEMNGCDGQPGVYPDLEGDKLERDIQEFAASLVWVLESRRLDRSFEKLERFPLLKAPFESKDFVGLDTESRPFKKRCQGRMRKHLGDLSLQLGLAHEALLLYSEAIELLRAVPDWLWLAAAYEGQGAASLALQWPRSPQAVPLQRNASFPKARQPRPGGASRPEPLYASNVTVLPNGTEPSEYKAAGRAVLSLDEMTERLREATAHYAKYSHVVAVHTECNMKAARFLAAHERYMSASEFLQNAVSMNLPLTESEKVEWYASLARLYSEVGFQRKAAFYTRVAAVKCMAGPGPNPSQCYQLLLKSLDGYRLNLDPSRQSKNCMNGWPRIQIQLLEDLIVTAKKMGNLQVAVRHTSYLLHAMLEYLSVAERQELCAQLESLASQCEPVPGALALDCGTVLPPVHLLQLPYVRCVPLSLVPQRAAAHLRPLRLGLAAEGTSSPFIFSPLQPHRRSGRSAKLDLLWVEGEVCAVALQLCNPMPFELRVSHMSLLVDGLPFECFPSSLELPPESSPYPVKLLGTPRGTGDLHILGYATCVLGVQSSCRVRDLPQLQRSRGGAPRDGALVLTVVPALPQLEVVAQGLSPAATFSTVGDTSHVVKHYALALYAGESHECLFTLTNTGKEPIESLETTLQTKLDKESEQAMFAWGAEELTSQLPIPAGGQCQLHASRHGTGTLPRDHGQQEPLGPGSPQQPAGVGIPPWHAQAETVEAVLQFQYSGGPGLRARYCRQHSVALTVEVQPSLLISQWDVLPAQVASECYLVLDVSNGTEQEMELLYPHERRMLMEAHDSCRIPVTVRRCSPPTAEEHDRGGGAPLGALEAALEAPVLSDLWLHRRSLTAPHHGIERSGKASIAEVPWTPRMLDAILLSPLQWEIRVNNKPHELEQEYVFDVGEPLVLSVSIRNISERPLKRLWLSAGGYQDRQNGTLSYRLDSKCAFVGCNKVFVDEVAPGDTYVHDFTVAFFLCGTYRLELGCRSLDLEGLGSLSALAAAALSASATDEDASHLWRCTLELNVAAPSSS